MAQPNQAKKEARKAQKEYEAVYGKEGEPTPAEPAPAPAATVPTEPAAEPPKAPVVDITPPAQPQEPAKPVDWEQKYRTLDGKYTAEVPRLLAQNTENNVRIAQLEAQINAVPAAPPVPAEPAATELEALLKQEEIDDYGKDMISVVKRAAREEFMPEINRLREENESLRGEFGKVETTIAVSSQEKMFRSLDIDVKNWRELNRDPSFLDWLARGDVYSGVSRQELLTKAFEEGNTARVTQFFTGYLAEQTPSTPEAPAAPPLEPAVPGSRLDTLVAPSRPQNPADTGGAPQSDLIWSQASINAFYADAQKGKFKGREKEHAALERDIFAAMKEGRVIG